MGVSARNLDALIDRYKRTAAGNPAQMAALVDAQLFHWRRAFRAATHVRTGHMRGEWHKERTGTLSGRVYNSDPVMRLFYTGTRAHNIPHAFGYAAPFGTSGRFSGMFHPGMKADQNLISVTMREVGDTRARFKQFGIGVRASLDGRSI